MIVLGPATRSLFTSLKCFVKGRVENDIMSAFSSFLNKSSNPSNETPQNPLTSSSAAGNQPSLGQGQQTAGSSNGAAAGPSLNINPPSILASSINPTGGSAASVRLREIAQQSQKLNEKIRAGSADLPKLELSLGMIREKAKELSRRAGGSGRENIQQANFLLAPSGLNPSETGKKISSLHLHAPPPPAQVPQAPAMDVQTFLAERRTQNILSAIEKGLQRTSNTFTSELARYRNTSWEALKKRTLEKHRGIASGETFGKQSIGPISQFDPFGRSR